MDESPSGDRDTVLKVLIYWIRLFYVSFDDNFQVNAQTEMHWRGSSKSEFPERPPLPGQIHW